MTFNPMPQTLNDRRESNLAHMQNLLNIINQMGSFSENPLPKYNYGQLANNINTDVSKDYAATMLLASGANNFGGGNLRKAAIQRRLQR